MFDRVHQIVITKPLSEVSQSDSQEVVDLPLQDSDGNSAPIDDDINELEGDNTQEACQDAQPPPAKKQKETDLIQMANDVAAKKVGKHARLDREHE